MTSSARGRGEFTGEVTGNVIADADDELAASHLRDAEFPSLLNLRLNAIAEIAGLGLHGGKELALGRALNAEHVLHHEHSRTESGHVFEEDAIELAAFVFANA